MKELMHAAAALGFMALAGLDIILLWGCMQ
jgi:hypothetical protein